MELQLSAEEAQTLRQVIEAKLAELVVEIRHTDSRSYREELKRRRDTLRRIDDALLPLSEQEAAAR